MTAELQTIHSIYSGWEEDKVILGVGRVSSVRRVGRGDKVSSPAEQTQVSTIIIIQTLTYV